MKLLNAFLWLCLVSTLSVRTCMHCRKELWLTKVTKMQRPSRKLASTWGMSITSSGIIFKEKQTPQRGCLLSQGKLHWLMHSALLGKYLSPRKLWCFKGEDFMRCMQHLAGSCVAGNALATSNLKMMQHWRVAAHRQWLKNS